MKINITSILLATFFFLGFQQISLAGLTLSGLAHYAVSDEELELLRAQEEEEERLIAEAISETPERIFSFEVNESALWKIQVNETVLTLYATEGCITDSDTLSGITEGFLNGELIGFTPKQIFNGRDGYTGLHGSEEDLEHCHHHFDFKENPAKLKKSFAMLKDQGLISELELNLIRIDYATHLNSLRLAAIAAAE